ncbi:MAG TPA: N-acetylmuramic acid 6-phosphate etherase, partial [Flavobacteriales bacterium]|nr:N-acetylmuramic acid 6-phosphate etherase [Flavobacteriales bacterium]
MNRITESESHHRDLDKMSTHQLLAGINSEDKKVAHAVEQCIPQIEKLVDGIVVRMQKGGRLFYIG